MYQEPGVQVVSIVATVGPVPPAINVVMPEAMGELGAPSGD